jgi:diguanylate cyclase (GGDEF)-like protein/PAS domain S-box-containing protein
VPAGKQWVQHQLLGALMVTVPLQKAQMWADTRVTQAALFLFGILAVSFVSLAWFNWRLVRQQRDLLRAEDQLARSERETQAANALVQAKLGVEQALAELSSYTQAIDQHALVSVTDRTGRILQVNARFVAVSGYAADELIGQDHRILNSGTHDAAFFANLWATIGRGDIWRGVVCNRAKAGHLYWVDSAIVPMRDASGAVTRYISIRIDITERKLVEQEMLHMATHDALTGLANRAMLLDRMEQALASARRTGEMAAVVFIDLDQFKAINDTMGHSVGDRLLVEVAARLKACVRAEDTVARQGGDEFIVFMPRIHTPLDAATLAQKLLRQVAAPYLIDAHPLHIGASMGIAVFPDDGQDVDTLLMHSDAAMYQVKASGRNAYRFHQASSGVWQEHPGS